MPRIARLVVPGHPHHIVQRGNRRLPTFFIDDDFHYYLGVVREWCDRHSVDIWAYCLMTNHVHLIAVPQTEDGLRRAFGEAHRRYTIHVNRREGWTGHLWQGRFASYVMDESHLLAATRYIELNPVRANMVADPLDYRWSSARAHATVTDDHLVKCAPLRDLVTDWRVFLQEKLDPMEVERIRLHERTGRPLGDDGFLGLVGTMVGRDVRPKKAGRKRKK